MSARALDGRVAIVTGGASGLGEAIAHRLAALGAYTIVADRDADAAERVATAIAAGGARARAVTADVTRRDDVVRMIAAAADAGGLHALVLSAAVEVTARLADTTDEQWQRVIDVNLKGPFLCMKHGIPLMVRSGGGSIVALGSTLGEIGQPGFAAYCASKGALVNLCKQAAIEHAPDRIRVNVLSPSACDVGLFVRTAERGGDPEGVKAMVASRVPMGRLGSARDVCDAVAYLASDASAYLSGTVVPLDGGLAARRER
jgi:NAD(P)-dependent dehydrogenase (short-subunit alcohol dehydrogenase family)